MSFSDFRESIFEEGASNNAFDDKINFEGESFNEKIVIKFWVLLLIIF